MTKILVIKEQRKRQPIVKVTRLQNSYKLVSNVNIFFNDDYQIIYKHFVPFCESEETVVVEEETNIQLSCHKKKQTVDSRRRFRFNMLMNPMNRNHVKAIMIPVLLLQPGVHLIQVNASSISFKI